MSNRRLKDYTSVQIEQVKTFCEASTKIRLEEGKTNLYISLEKNIRIDEIIDLLDLLWNNEFEIAFHDTIHITISDPGAYFSYSPQKSPGINFWSMTCGNHGWSGGIYHISRKTLAKQIGNLIRHSKIESVQITGVLFFSHYQVKSTTESELKDNYLSNIHDY